MLTRHGFSQIQRLTQSGKPDTQPNQRDLPP
jgi:hypothetical protein